jgi:hypothetical protein
MNASLAERVKKMTKDGLSARVIAGRLGISERHVRRLRAEEWGPGKGNPEDESEARQKGRGRNLLCPRGCPVDTAPHGASPMKCLECGSIAQVSPFFGGFGNRRSFSDRSRTPDGRVFKSYVDSGAQPGPETVWVRIADTAQGIDSAEYELAVDHPELCRMIGRGMEPYFRDWD